MDLEALSALAAMMPGAVEEWPFGPDVDVFKVGGKIFAILSGSEDSEVISLKCEPALAEELRREFTSVTPGYHLNKRHWNSVALDGVVPSEELLVMLTHSYERVVASLTRAARSSLGLDS